VIRVLLADDLPLARIALRTMLEEDDDFSVVGEARDGEEAVALARETEADVMLMDLCMPGLDGLEATRQIVAEQGADGLRVIILTTYETDERAFETLRAGASGFMLKDAEPEELLRGIRIVAEGDALVAPSVTRRLIAEFAAQPTNARVTPEQLEWLTRRELEVLALVAGGLSNEEIATQLVISRATAKTHVSRAMRKLQAHDRAQLVVIAYQSGLVVPGRPEQGAA
jgi:DNA-binding NarL/FixJ family response regulator